MQALGLQNIETMNSALDETRKIASAVMVLIQGGMVFS